MGDKSILGDLGISNLGADGAMAAGHALSRPAEEYENNAEVEMMWAIKAYEHAETYYKLISAIDPKLLKLTPLDDEINGEFVSQFPDFTLDILKIDELKTDDAKEKWRNYCNQFENTVEDFNFATLVRLDCKGDYSEENSILVTRIQFFAIEIARNRRGLNSSLHLKKQHNSASSDTS